MIHPLGSKRAEAMAEPSSSVISCTVTATHDDFDVVEFATMLAQLDEHLPISDAYEREVPQRTGVWWTSQREHMVRWFGGQTTTGSGAFTRSAPNRSARMTYGRLQCPAALVWIAEALGEDPVTVEVAAGAARAAPNARRRSGVLRRHLPWSRIAELATAAQYLSTVRYSEEGRVDSIFSGRYGEDLVIVDPRLNGGQPSFFESGVRIEDARRRVDAGEPLEQVADDFDIAPETIRAVFARER